ncbi:uncharacterized protein K452DRAFT_292186 [Aplosporella prunicola CBS 121167]|uniref:Heterokaryon incompatibility domain-containing protein n=1 Tax=Aplosporella prunicola CBS 121167 TaxID=1176127 RepID=A0A6A6B097_9PEZI|nr:uncharacterized protein K452DRAFT_292186 [Aplosporella prunicola CBS 121167]KAF2136664.1 hypothetical protein K452DRAFT_292186 [Aplosporella prunicola CBS 121167]
MDSLDFQNMDNCRFCEFFKVESRYGRKYDNFELFHRECSHCQSQPQSEENLCAFCQHLRIGHLLLCVPQELSIYIDFKSKHEHIYDTKCPMCRLMASIPSTNPVAFRDGRDPIRSGFFTLDFVLHLRPYLKKTDEKSLGYLMFNEINGQEVFHNVRIYASDSSPRPVGSSFDHVLVTEWLSKHCMDHEKSFGHKVQLPRGFQVIDVFERRIVSPENGFQYVALSYVWGSKRDSLHLVATKENIHGMTQRGGVDASRLPATIDDAIEICILLGERYLWVDQLCIVQDDHENKHRQIHAMDSIYTAAHFVMVVADGDAHSGIPGFRHKRPTLQRRENIGTFTFLNSLPSASDTISSCVWNSRAWTYQEAVLARRRLYFSLSQAFLETSRSICLEDLTEDNDEFIEFEPVLSLKPVISSPRRDDRFLDWTSHLEAYSCRTLSYRSDAVNAFMGISRAFYPKDGAMFIGLPKPDFHRGLLWYCESENPRRVTENSSFPSWSWASVIGTVGYIDSLDASVTPLVAWRVQQANLQAGTTYEWTNIRDFVGAPSVDSAEPDSSELDPEILWSSRKYDSFALALAWSQGCFEVCWPFASLESCRFSSIKSRLKDVWPTRRCLEDLFFGDSKSHEEQLLPKVQQNVLRARVQSAHFWLDVLSQEPRNSFCGFPNSLKISDENNKYVGLAWKHEPRIKEEVLPLLEPGEKTRFEFIALSITSFRHPEALFVHGELSFGIQTLLDPFRNTTYKTPEERRYMREHLGPDGLDITYFDSEDNALEQVPLVNVMLIAWRGPVAHRVSVGWIFLTKWAKAKREFKTVYLE